VYYKDQTEVIYNEDISDTLTISYQKITFEHSL